MNYLLPFLAALFLSLILTYFVRKIAYQYNILSKPRARDVHKNPLPRIGGIAIFLAFIVVAGSMFFFNKDLTFGYGHIFGIDRRFLGIALGGLLIAVTMLYDDLKGLSAWQKLLVQMFVAFVIIAFGIGIDSLANPFGNPINLNVIYVPIFALHGTVYHFSLLSDLLTLIWIVGMMNIINFVDGVDGLASGLSTIAALTIFFLSISVAVSQPATAMIAIILAGASLGFLFWNFPPAKIFMGDTGSMFLGFMLGVLPLISGGKLATVFLVLGFPIIDGLFVAIGRIVRGKNPLTTPDKTHLHHRLLKAGLTQRQAILLIYLIATIFGRVALRSTSLTKIIAMVASVLLVAIFIIVLTYLKDKQIKKKLV